MTISTLEDNSESSCPYKASNIIKYLELEDACEVSKQDVFFHRTAKIDKIEYWLFRYKNEEESNVGLIISRKIKFFFREEISIATWGDPAWSDEELLLEYHKMNVRRQ